MNYEQMNNNKVYLKGVVDSDPVFSHEIYGEGFYEMNLSVARLSDHCDIIPITVSERLLEGDNFKRGKEVAIRGQFRSYNKVMGDHSKLMLTVFVRELCDLDENKNSNIIELTGYICKPPIYRTTPFKREIGDLLLAVNRAYNKSDYLPCIAWGRNARFIKGVQVGEKVSIIGRIQSREYQKKLDENNFENRVAYEVSIGKIMVENEKDIINENSSYILTDMKMDSYYAGGEV
ncbi:MAG: single-stranded DNA-binding protein [Clostridia bacterium]|nr:single-stranded DNA-binding protein [Clostridia bacterium]